jgi:magnesium transporter
MPDLIAQAEHFVEAGERDSLRTFFGELHYADAADLIQALRPDMRLYAVEMLREGFDPNILPELPEEIRAAVVEKLGLERAAEAIAELEADDATLVLESLDRAGQAEILDELPRADRLEIEEALAFPEKSAGRLMQRELVKVPSEWSVGQTIDHLRSDASVPDDFYDIFVIDEAGRPMGTARLSQVLRNERAVRMRDIMESKSDLTTIPIMMDQEEIAFLFRQRDLTSAPVVDAKGRLAGVITIDDVVDVMQEEAEEDILKLGGVTESDLHASVAVTTLRRSRWLIVTVVKTLLAVSVIAQFEATIERMVALAVLMPIASGMAGDAGMQAATVTVRAIATRELAVSNAVRQIGKELMVGSLNGGLFATLLGLATALWFQDPSLGLVLAGALICNLVWAGFAGTAVPIALTRLGLDPAISAGPFVTTTTDVLGFFSFLGLATLILF